MKKELTQNELNRRDFFSWLKDRGKLPNGKDYSFKGHSYLEQIAKHHWVPGDQLYLMKSAQCGATELAWDWVMWQMERRLDEWQACGFCFPATEQLRDHIKARVNPILELPRFAKNLKQQNLRSLNYCDRPVYFRASQTRRDMISWAADAVVMDEFDEWANPLGAIKTIEARFGHSLYKWIWAQSTPKYPDIGIDAAFALSNQHHWFTKCMQCEKEFSPMMEVMASSFDVCVSRDENGVAGFVCPHCHKYTLTNGTPGRWVMVKAGKKQRYGYSISKLFVGHASLDKLLDDFEEAHNTQEFYNSELGLAYSPANARLSRENLIESAIGDKKCALGSVEPTYAGIDVGKKCHYFIAKKTPTGEKQVIAYGMAPFDDLEELLRKFNVVNLVIDLRPWEQSVKKLIKGKKGWFASDYNASGSIDWYDFTRADVGAKGGSVKVVKNHRTQTCDNLIEQIAVRKNWILPEQIKTDNTFLKQMCAMQRMEKVENDTGEIKAFYGNGGKADHYFHAAAYLELAFLARRSSVFARLGPLFHG